MRFTTVSLLIAIGISNVNGFGVPPSIQRNSAFKRYTSPVCVPNSRDALTKVEMGVNNPPPNETTGIKALVR